MATVNIFAEVQKKDARRERLIGCGLVIGGVVLTYTVICVLMTIACISADPGSCEYWGPAHWPAWVISQLG